MITNSIRVNLAKECHRGEISYRLWHSDLGKNIKTVSNIESS